MRSLASFQYEIALGKCALDLAGEGGFTAKQLCDRCDFTLSPSVRKYLRKMVSYGQLQSVIAHTERGNMATFYIKPIPENELSQSVLPLTF